MVRHASIRLLVLTALFAAMSLDAMAQAGVDQIQAVISGPVTGQSARTLTHHLAARPGVRLCRVDPVSRNVLLHVDQGFHLNEQAMRHLFAQHGLHLRCYTRQPRTGAPFQLLDPRTCGHAPLER